MLVERLEELADDMERVAIRQMKRGELPQTSPYFTQLRAIIEALKKRDEAVRLVAKSLEWEDVGYVVAYAARLREALDE